MPVMNGFEATSIIKSFSDDIVVFGVSGSTAEKDVKEALDSGMAKVFEKPLNCRVIRPELEELGYQLN